MGAMRYDLDRTRREMDALFRQMLRKYYNFAAYGKSLKIRSAFRKHKSLLDRGLIDFVRERMDAAEGEEKRRLHFLLFALVDTHMRQRTSRLVEEFDRISPKTVRVDGKEIPVSHIYYLISNEPRRAQRRKLLHSLSGITREWNKVANRMKAEKMSMSRQLGFKDSTEMYEQAHMMDFDDFDRIVSDFLRKTDRIYRKLRKEVAKDVLNLRLNELRMYDDTAMWRAREFDTFFPRRNLMDTVYKTLSGMGLDLKKQRNIRIDNENRPTKSVGAAFYAMDIPSDIRILVKSAGGVDNYAGLFHELGHAEHYAYMDRRLPFEFKWLGGGAITETFAFVFERVLFDKAWLREYTNMTGRALKRYMRVMTYLKLTSMRGVCLRFKFDLALHRGRRDIKRYFAKLFEDIFFMKLDKFEKLCYFSYSNDFYSVNHLCGWFLDAQLRFRLRRKFGAKWFESRRCGQYLKRLWSEGNKFTADELARRVGFDGVDARYLIGELRI